MHIPPPRGGRAYGRANVRASRRDLGPWTHADPPHARSHPSSGRRGVAESFQRAMEPGAYRP